MALGARPWEALAGTRPWETNGQVIYVRRVTITRPNPAPAKGLVTYQGQTNADESIITINGISAVGVPCTIQRFLRAGRSIRVDLPADVTGRGEWSVFFPLFVQQFGGFIDFAAFRRSDTLIDENGIRYQVKNCYWNSLGYRLDTEQMEP